MLPSTDAPQRVVLILQHEESDTPAYMTEYLGDRGIKYAVLKLWEDAAYAILPTSAKTPIRCIPHPITPHRFVPVANDTVSPEGECCVIMAVASMGGTMSVNDHLHYYDKLYELLRSCTSTRTPYMGHCLGAQLLAKALGGTVDPSPVPEVGWVQLWAENHEAVGVKDWFGGSKQFEAFQIHGECFSIPPGCHRIATGAFCPNQAFQYGDQYVLGTQFHPEVDAEKIRSLIRDTPNLTLTNEQVKSMTAEELANVPPCMQTKETIEAAIAAGRILDNRYITHHMYGVWCKGFVQ